MTTEQLAIIGMYAFATVAADILERNKIGGINAIR